MTTITVPAGEPSATIERLIRIDTKLDVVIAQQSDHEGRIRALETDNVVGGHQDHESRIRRLERSLWLLAGAAAAGGGIVGSLLGPLIGK